jgi:type 1 glutamine amidotransferase
MRRFRWLFVIVAALVALGFLVSSVGFAKKPQKGKLLYMTLCMGYKHDTVPLSKDIVKKIGDSSGAFETTVTEDVGAFTAENLKNYDAVMFNTTGELPMSEEQKKAFADFVKSGHGFIGVHSATDTFYSWEPYLKIIGGYFNGHPWHEQVTIDVTDPASPLVSFMGRSFEISDEIYQAGDFQADDTHVLLRLDTDKTNMKKPGVQHRFYGWPVAWTRMYGKGRVYYNGLGHDKEVWESPQYQKMLLAGIQWAMGQLK